MNSKIKTVVFAALFVLLILGAYILYNTLADQMDMSQLSTQAAETTAPRETDPSQENDSTRPAEPENQAPDFTVYTLDGTPAKLSDFVGKPVVLNFWSSRCGPCKMEMPDFQKTYEELGEEIHFLMVNVTDGYWDTLDTASAFIAQEGYTFPVYYDTDVDASSVFGTSSLPVTFFFDAEGQGVAYGMGAMDYDTLMSGIDMIYPPEN